MMEKNRAELILDAKALLGEGPCWDAKTNTLIWVDINGHTVNVYNPMTREDKRYDVGEYVGAAVVRENGGLLLALTDGFYSFDMKTETISRIEDTESHIKTNRFNDGKCDPKGRFWAGTMVLDGNPGEANLYRLDNDLTVQLMVADVTVSNGLAWDITKSCMYYIDTRTKAIRTYDFDNETGNIANAKTAVTFKPEMGSPDGMTIDEEGMLWVAFFRGWKVIRLNPETGQTLMEVKVPASQVTSCTFGGENLDELYITTARNGLSDADLTKQPHAGGLFKFKPGVKGVPSYTFQDINR